MKHTENHPAEIKNFESYFYVIGAVLGALIGFVARESVLGLLLGLVIGLVFAAFFVKSLLPQRAHDR